MLVFFFLLVPRRAQIVIEDSEKIAVVFILKCRELFLKVFPPLQAAHLPGECSQARFDFLQDEFSLLKIVIGTVEFVQGLAFL